MNLLAIDTSTDTASVALLFGDTLNHIQQGNQRAQARFLLPMINELLVSSGCSLNQLNAIAFGCGPGSFTGLRIACSVAKGLAYAHDLDLIPVSSLATIAWAARQQLGDKPILAVLDARMRELYWAYYPEQQYHAEEQVQAAADISLSASEPAVLAGVGIDEYWEDFSEAMKYQVRDKLTIYPDAVSMIQLIQCVKIQPVSVAEAQPAYVRNKVTY